MVFFRWHLAVLLFVAAAVALLLLWRRLRPRSDISAESALEDFAQRRRVSKFAAWVLLVCAASTVILLFVESRTPMVQIDPKNPVSPRVAVSGPPGNLEVVLMMGIIVVIPVFAIFTIWLVYRCPRCGESLKLSATFEPRQCLFCGLSLCRFDHSRVGEDDEPELQPERFRPLFLVRRRRAYVLNAVAIGPFFGVISADRPGWAFLPEEWRAYTMFGSMIFLGLTVLAPVLVSRCPACGRVLGIGRYLTRRPAPKCDVEERSGF